MTGLILTLVTLALASGFGALWRSRQGRVRLSASTPSSPAGGVGPEAVLRQLDGCQLDGCQLDGAAEVTLLQLTSPVCAQCPQTRAVLTELASATSGVRHAELNLADHPELAGQLGVRSTPTTLALSRSGQELFRVRGVPRPAELLAALAPHLSSAPEPGP